MKKVSIIASCALAAALLANTACNKLEEYNPSSTTAENVFTTVEGYEALVNQCYSNLRAMCYGREDMMFMGETGTDIWHAAYDRDYAPQINKYRGLTSSLGMVRNVWERFYVPINLCNAAIERADNAGYTDENRKNAKAAEAHFVRAFIYWHIVEWYGNVSLVTKETTAPVLTAYRSPVDDFYKLMFDDLKFALQWLPNNHAAGENGKATKKAAHGMLARMYLTYASYLKYHAGKDAEAQEYYRLASATANEVIAAKATYGVDLYADCEDIFAPENNKNNTEALYVVSHTSNVALEVNSGNPNRLFQWFQSRYSNKIGMKMSLDYSRDVNNSAYMQPTRYLLELFKEDRDARYAATFQEVWLANDSSKLKWTQEQLNWFKKDTNVVRPNSSIGAVGDTALLYTKKQVDDKRTRKYAVVDIDDMYDDDGKMAIYTKISSYQCFPALRKFRDPNRADANSQAGSNDIILMRLAEMYLIAAEAEFHLELEGDGLSHVNILRNRAQIPGAPSNTADAAEIAAAGGHLNFMLDERARELCGEHLRWFDLKRTKQLENRLGAAISNGKGNPNIVDFDKAKHYVRPIPLNFLQNLENEEEFGNNPYYD
ncbi:MAG: RagB/SusD family nutrient uptake outer membrane protein [Prevotellaceae bacterium]|jgi:hypothetical protein|nr:RagB/SusD family nutrient uptake outer membrane protein [Prevotellaceae bacterium]